MKHHSRQYEPAVNVKCYNCEDGYVFNGVTYRLCPECGGWGWVTMTSWT